jgi:hypothetical protein
MNCYLYASDLGDVDYIGAFESEREARAAIRSITAEIKAWGADVPVFLIQDHPPYQPTYTFPDMSGMG